MQQAIRDALVAFIDPQFRSVFPDYTIVYDNGPFDWNNPPDTFVEVQTEFYDGEQVNLGISPRRRVSGYLYVTVRTRAGKGSRHVLQVLDWFSETLKFAHVGPAQLQAPQPDGNHPVPGWYIEDLKVPFKSDPG